jgi:Lysozyme like domain
MSTESFAQLEQLWIQAGGPSSLAPTMAAIAEAESSGDPDAQNDTDNGGTQSSFGLWQISTGTHTPPASNWDDPLENAELAVEKYDTQGLSAWGTYDSGAYEQYLNGADSSSGDTSTGDTSGTTSSILDPFDWGSAISGFETDLKSMAITIPVLLGAVVIVVIGLWKAFDLPKPQAMPVPLPV